MKSYIRIVTDGSPLGTKMFAPNGDLLDGLISLEVPRISNDSDCRVKIECYVEGGPFSKGERINNALPALTQKYREMIGDILMGTADINEATRAERVEKLLALCEIGEAHLGCATTAELLEELRARAEMRGYAKDRTIDQ